jgi:hypothetical protein
MEGTFGKRHFLHRPPLTGSTGGASLVKKGARRNGEFGLTQFTKLPLGIFLIFAKF